MGEDRRPAQPVSLPALRCALTQTLPTAVQDLDAGAVATGVDEADLHVRGAFVRKAQMPGVGPRSPLTE